MNGGLPHRGSRTDRQESRDSCPDAGCDCPAQGICPGGAPVCGHLWRSRSTERFPDDFEEALCDQTCQSPKADGRCLPAVLLEELHMHFVPRWAVPTRRCSRAEGTLQPDRVDPQSGRLLLIVETATRTEKRYGRGQFHRRPQTGTCELSISRSAQPAGVAQLVESSAHGMDHTGHEGHHDLALLLSRFEARGSSVAFSSRPRGSRRPLPSRIDPSTRSPLGTAGR